MADTWGGMDPDAFRLLPEPVRAMRSRRWVQLVERARVEHDARYHSIARRRALLEESR